MFLQFPYNDLLLGIKCSKKINLNESDTAKAKHFILF